MLHQQRNTNPGIQEEMQQVPKVQHPRNGKIYARRVSKAAQQDRSTYQNLSSSAMMLPPYEEPSATSSNTATSAAVAAALEAQAAILQAQAVMLQLQAAVLHAQAMVLRAAAVQEGECAEGLQSAEGWSGESGEGCAAKGRW